jgi:hypothetical protein
MMDIEASVFPNPAQMTVSLTEFLSLKYPTIRLDGGNFEQINRLEFSYLQISARMVEGNGVPARSITRQPLPPPDTCSLLRSRRMRSPSRRSSKLGQNKNAVHPPQVYPDDGKTGRILASAIIRCSCSTSLAMSSDAPCAPGTCTAPMAGAQCRSR